MALADVLGVQADLAKAGMLNLAPVALPTIPALGSLFVNLTARCNLACVHCFRGDADARCLDLAVVKTLVDDLVAAGGRSIVLSGGEPLLYPHIKELLGYIGRRLKVQLATNGTLLDREWAEFLAATLNPVIQISLEGATAAVHDPIRGKGSFDRSIQAVRHLQAVGLGEKLIFSTTIMNQNRGTLPAIVALAAELAVPTVRFLLLRNEGHASETWQLTGEALGRNQYEDLFEQFLAHPGAMPPGVEVRCGLSGFFFDPSLGDPDKRHWCDLGKLMVVDVDGEVYPCALMMEGGFRLGSVLTDSLADLHACAALAEVCHAVANRHRQASGCAQCLWNTFCQAGCLALAYREQGTIWAHDSFCSYRKGAYARGFDRILGAGKPGPTGA